jgi:hypothetical protein
MHGQADAWGLSSVVTVALNHLRSVDVYLEENAPREHPFGRPDGDELEEA